MNEHRFYRKQVKKILQLKPSKIEGKSESINENNFSICSGHQQGNYYVIEIKGKDDTILKLFFTLEDYRNLIRPLKANWINNKILNRSEMGVRIWGSEKEPNKLRRRLEQKAERGTLTREEKNIIIKEVENLLAEIKQSRH